MKVETKIKLAKRNGTIEILRKELIQTEIQKKYYVTDELAIQRQRDSKPEEFALYNTYVEDCKIKIDTLIASVK